MEPYKFEWVEANSIPFNPERAKTAMSDANSNRNRYNNVLPFDDTRVVLNDTQNYINASYICGRRYISCQAPMTNTFEDFYRMVWDENSPLIVMLTKFEENDRRKADPYFPDGKEMKRCGVFEVKTGAVLFKDVPTVRRTQVQIRELIITNKALGQKRSVVHIHYLGWPDFGVPASTKPIIDLALLSTVFRGTVKGTKLEGPVVVHCSAGLGRSGTFIGLLRVFDHHILGLVKNPPSFLVACLRVAP